MARTRAKVLHHYFEAKAARRPEAPALFFGADRISYAELDARSNQAARLLRSRGLGPGSRVGLCLPRSPELYAGLLGILKAGAAYVPIDPAYPPKRREFILSRSGAPGLLSAGPLASSHHNFPGMILDMEPEGRGARRPDASPLHDDAVRTADELR